MKQATLTVAFLHDKSNKYFAKYIGFHSQRHRIAAFFIYFWELYAAMCHNNCFFSPALRDIEFLFPLKLMRVFPPFREKTANETTFPSFHSMSTTKPPRAQIPFTLPSFHCAGKAGSRMISSAVDCINISTTPAQPPKLPSI